MSKHLFGEGIPEFCAECGKCSCTKKNHCEAIIVLYNYSREIFEEITENAASCDLDKNGNIKQVG